MPYIPFTFSFRIVKFKSLHIRSLFLKEILLIYSNKTKKYVRKTNKMHSFVINLFNLDFPGHVSNK